MQLKKMAVCLTTGLLMSFGAAAENYRWDNVAMGGTCRCDTQAGRGIAPTAWLSEKDTGLMGVESLAIDPNNAANVYLLAGTEYFSNGKIRPRGFLHAQARPLSLSWHVFRA